MFIFLKKNPFRINETQIIYKVKANVRLVL